jgi:protein-L-isoaspartate(D-aspartate) O-methyltransferase
MDNLKPGGRLLLPLTFEGYRTEAGYGGFFKIVREQNGFSARFVCPTGILHFTGARTAEAGRLLSEAFRNDAVRLADLASLRRDRHEKEPACWLHGDGYCFSTRPPGSAH